MKKQVIWAICCAGAAMLALAGCGSAGVTSGSAPGNAGNINIKAKTVEGFETETYTGGADGQEGHYYVHVPEGYDAEDMHYPVIYLMPYDGYSAEQYFEDGIDARMDEIMDSEAAQDMILVIAEFSGDQDYDAMLPDLIADVDEKYDTIPESDYRGILGVNVGGYMAYEAVLNSGSELFYATGSHAGDFTSEANPYLYKGDVMEAVNAMDRMDKSKGYNYLSEHYFYLDAPNEDALTNEGWGSADIGAGLEKHSNPYYQYNASEYSTPDINMVNFAILDGTAGSDYYLTQLERSLSAFSDMFVKGLCKATLQMDARAVTEDVDTISGHVDVTFSNLIQNYTEAPDRVQINVRLLDGETQEVLEEQALEMDPDGMQKENFSFDKQALQSAEDGYVACQMSILGKTMDIDTQPVVLVNDFDPASGEQPVIDLRGDWYFNAYKQMSDKKDNELDSVQGITPSVYESWNLVQPGFGWWTFDFDSTLNGQENFAGYAWYVRTFEVDEAFPTEDLLLAVGYFDEANEVYLNGKLVGSTGMNYDTGVGVYDNSNPWDVNCIYEISAGDLKYGQENTIAVRMCNSDGGGGWYDGPMGIYTTASYAVVADHQSDRIVEESYVSAAVNDQEQTYRVYLPEGYDEKAADEYPTLYLLHGINSTSKAFVIDGIDKLLDEAITNGEIQPMIVVMPDDPTKTSFWKGSYATMVAEDLLADVEAKYHVSADRDQRYIAGCSMGGAGAMNIGLNYPDTYGGIISFYGALGYVNAQQTAGKMSAEELSSYKIWMACGNQDMYDFYADQENMSCLLTQKGVEHYHYVNNGTHSSTFYLPLFIKSIQYVQGQDVR